MPEKVFGTEVPFVDYITITYGDVVTQGKIAGVYGYQQYGVNVTATALSAFQKGSMDDISKVLADLNIKLLYARITWNQTAVTGGYEIRDLAIGLVFKCIVDTKTGRIPLALKTIGWLVGIIKDISFVHDAYILLTEEVPPPEKELSTEVITAVVLVAVGLGVTGFILGKRR